MSKLTEIGKLLPLFDSLKNWLGRELHNNPDLFSTDGLGRFKNQNDEKLYGHLQQMLDELRNQCKNILNNYSITNLTLKDILDYYSNVQTFLIPITNKDGNLQIKDFYKKLSKDYNDLSNLF